MAEIAVDEALVRGLLAEQHPDLAELRLREVVGGWDNQMWRLGDEYAVRIPRTPRAPSLLRTELQWLPSIAERLPLPIPVPLRSGAPSDLFPKPWHVVGWVSGEPADRSPITHAESAEVLAGFLKALHTEAPVDAPISPDRSAPLSKLTAGFDHGLAYAELDDTDLTDEALRDAVRRIWNAGVAAPVWPGAPSWLHADLHPANVLVTNGALSGVIDFGDLCAGDPATDLAAAWLLLPAGSAPRFLEAYGGVDDATIGRALAWAAYRALGLISIGRAGDEGLRGGKPTWRPAGRAALARVLDHAGVVG
ncbi:aminoglycoside phosphotransferase family protein [Kribbella sp. CA-293567]|uniref:aminoglycoside phosphotransferase family protein n=1 Tax=Kribbella sp. CA-293567 TaxID=3002436 RepID=UPI0022DE3635|nr:aminoglycoside phosphotransferase family protein [Kribbella sp. CA-293567]WBQ03144.1 aminoglycoside phosphotransferase family protein [Kribbella sp. CA-293567]